MIFKKPALNNITDFTEYIQTYDALISYYVFFYGQSESFKSKCRQCQIDMYT